MPHDQNVSSPILIIGPGRSGSSWLVHALNQHPDVQALIENRLVDAMHNEIFESWWSSQWHWVCNDTQLLQRAVRACRRMMCIMFPGQAAQWVMKAIWEGRPWSFYREVFPDARYIHAVRSPLTAAPSMMEYLGAKNESWRKMAFVERQYINAHREALAVRDADLPYLMVRQEDMVADPKAVWNTVRQFCGLPEVEVKNLELEINAAASTAGHVRQGRPPMQWSKFSREMRDLCAQIDYIAQNQESIGASEEEPQQNGVQSSQSAAMTDVAPEPATTSADSSSSREISN